MHCVRLIVVFLVFELGFHFFTLLLYCKLGLADGLGPEEESFKNGRSSSRRNSKRIGDGNTFNGIFVLQPMSALHKVCFCFHRIIIRYANNVKDSLMEVTLTRRV